MSALRPIAAVELEWLKRAATDPKRSEKVRSDPFTANYREQRRHIMEAVSFVLIFLFWTASAFAQADWPMSNDVEFESDVGQPSYPPRSDPIILVDGFHHNFFVQHGFIEPFLDVAQADGFRMEISDRPFDKAHLETVDLVVIITALPFDFGTKQEVTIEETFTNEEIESVVEWVNDGGSLLVFSEHAPFDQAINPLLKRFGIQSSVGYVVDEKNHDARFGRTGWIVYSRENGLLHPTHPITQGHSAKEQIESLLTFGGSSLRGDGYTNLLKLAPSAMNIEHPTGVGPIGMGDSQGLAGKVGLGRVVALGDSNGFVAMKEATGRLGMNTDGYDWKQFVLNTLRWLSVDADTDK